MTLPGYKVEVAFNAGVLTPAASRTWTDVTAYALLDTGAETTCGRGDWRSSADANRLRLTFNNSDGRFTPGLTTSPYYPNVKLGRPIRVTAIPSPSNALNLLSVNAASVETSIADWSAAGTPLPVLAQSSTRAYSGVNSLLITWQGGGGFPQAQATVSGLAIGSVYTFSAWVYIPTGSNDIVPVFATATGAQVSARDQWVRTSVSFTATAASHSVAIRGIAPTIGNTCWADAFMVNAGAFATDFTTQTPATSTRYLGFVDEWPLEWPETVATFATSTVTASSRLAWIADDAELKSIVEQEYLLDGPVAYYTLGEAAGATAASDSSGNAQVPALTQTGSGTAVTFGNATGPGTDGLTAATFAGGKYLRATLPASAPTRWSYVLWFNTSSTAANMVVVEQSVIQIDLTGRVATVSPALNSTATYNDGATHMAALVIDTVGNTSELFVDGGSVATGTAAGVEFGTNLSVGSSDLAGVLAHVAIYTSALSSARVLAMYGAGLNGFAGETPAARLTRYASYAGIPATEVSFETGMVPDLAHIDTTGVTALEMMRKIEATEEGVLFDAADGTLTFHARNHRYSATPAFTLDVASRHIERGLSPRLDRAGIRNDVTATLTDGTASAHAFSQTSIDAYGPARESLDLATANAEEPFQHANWLVGQYAEPRPRVSQLGVINLVSLPAALTQAILTAGVGTRFRVTGMPTQAEKATQDYYIEGYSESIGPARHAITLNVSQAEPFDVWTVEDPVLGQYDAYPIAF